MLRAPWLTCPWARLIPVILGNHAIHETQLVRDLLRRMGGKIRLRFPPPHWPNQDRIERPWRDLHANVTCDHRCRTMQSLLANVLRRLETRPSAEEECALAV